MERMTQTTVYVSDRQLKQLQKLREINKVPVATMIRDAIDTFIENSKSYMSMYGIMASKRKDKK